MEFTGTQLTLSQQLSRLCSDGQTFRGMNRYVFSLKEACYFGLESLQSISHEL